MSQTPLPRTVVVLGLVSFFNDLASDMVIPLIPILLTTQLGAGPIALGLVEGVADAIASFLKLWSGRHSDLLGGKRKWLTVTGYALSNIARPLLGWVASWGQLLALRSLDRVGKGIRSAPRDALVADVTPPSALARAFGLHRALDNAGAVGGSLVAAAALAWWSLSLNEVVIWSCLPGAVGVLLVAVAVKEPTAAANKAAVRLPSLAWANLSSPMRRYLGLLFLFTFARVSETFIVLRGQETGMTVVHVLLLWSALNLAKALAASWGGTLADRIGRIAVLRASWLAYALAFVCFALADTPLALWLVTLAYGFFAGMSEGGERALIGEFAGAAERGTAFGWYNMVLGVAAIPAGLLFGSVWHFAGARAAFAFAACLAALAAALLHAWLMQRRALAAQESA